MLHRRRKTPSLNAKRQRGLEMIMVDLILREWSVANPGIYAVARVPAIIVEEHQGC
jgi:hypothetical protein